MNIELTDFMSHSKARDFLRLLHDNKNDQGIVTLDIGDNKVIDLQLLPVKLRNSIDAPFDPNKDL